jgi:hypothetical protein
MDTTCEPASTRSSGLLASRRLTRFSHFWRRHAVIILPALIFFALMVAINWELLVTPVFEDGDFAANALQVQNAKHMRELLGNYSRWHFHHPGPFFFYLFGAGEAISYDFLHIVPAPINGEILAELTFSTICLFLTIHIFYVHVRRPLFPPLAVLVSIVFLYAVDTAIPGSALVSLWPPYMSIFCFILLASSCASVAAGYWKHVILVAVSGMIMLHAHVAQTLFVAALTTVALSYTAGREFKYGTLRTALRAHRRDFLIALGIVLLFLLPIAIDAIVHTPSNLHQIRAYLHEHHREHNSLSTSLLYLASFFTYYVKPETVLANPAATWRDLLSPESFVRVYWCIFLFISVFSVIAYFGSRQRAPLFLKLVFFEVAFIILLFTYWSWRITGPMYTFNGYFFFSIQLLVLLALSSLAAAVVKPRLGRSRQIALTCAFTTPLLLVVGLKNTVSGDPGVHVIVSFLKQKGIKEAILVTPMKQETWPAAAGVASYMQRAGLTFCFEPQWAFVFGDTHVCRNNNVGYRVAFSESQPTCNAPCSLIYARPHLYVTGTRNLTSSDNSASYRTR